MSAYPLPTVGCKCGTCEQLRASTPPETPFIESEPLILKARIPKCPLCDMDLPLTGAHTCPVPPG